jgi:hypothetical protein
MDSLDHYASNSYPVFLRVVSRTTASWKSLGGGMGVVELNVMQELMWHSTIRVTLDTYTQAVTTEKRSAQTAVVRCSKALTIVLRRLRAEVASEFEGLLGAPARQRSGNPTTDPSEDR